MMYNKTAIYDFKMRLINLTGHLIELPDGQIFEDFGAVVAITTPYTVYEPATDRLKLPYYRRGKEEVQVNGLPFPSQVDDIAYIVNFDVATVLGSNRQDMCVPIPADELTEHTGNTKGFYSLYSRFYGDMQNTR